MGAISRAFTRAPLVGSLDMDYWCSALWAFGTKGALVNALDMAPKTCYRRNGEFFSDSIFATTFDAHCQYEGKKEIFSDFIFVTNFDADL